jgi:ABC-type molybdenum transport system ATPase subunit/photorepair protein PhrA
MSKPQLTEDARRRVNACLRWFAAELHPSPGLTTVEKLGKATANEVGSRNGIKEYLQTAQEGKDLLWADDVRFAELSFSNQRLILFLRAIVANPDLVILDEALSGIDEATRDKALLFLSHGEAIASVTNGQAEESALFRLGQVVFSGLSPKQALLVISHAREDVPGCLREWICLPEPGEARAPRTGTLPGPLELNPRCWNEIWGR